MDLPATLGDFRIEAVLGEGGSGVVYDAVWGPRQVALKVLHAHFVGTEKERAQFFGEAQRLAAIGHPHVVKVLAVGALPDGRPYLAMERLAGETLASVLARGPLALPAALAMFGELAGAVAALHAQGLVHRDLKPENVFVVGGQHAVLLDFGIAKEITGAASTVTQDGGVRGTPAYMAPERFFGQPAGVSTDVYELAVICYAMLSGRLPWDDLLDPEARLQPRSLLELAVDVPRDLDVELRRALSTRAANRPESAIALEAALRAAAGMASGDPSPADTAPLRSDSIPPDAARRPHSPSSPGATTVPRRPHSPSSPPTATAGGDAAKPWFAERAPTTDRGRTPLAWAPDQAPPPAPRARRGLVYALGGVAAISAGVAAFALVHDRAPAAEVGHVAPPIDAHVTVPASALLPATQDPWATPDPTPEAPPATGSGALPEGPARTASAYRAEAAASVAHLPEDTRAVIAIDVDQIMGKEPLAKLVRAAVGDVRVSALLALAPPCARTLISQSDWITYGAPKLADSGHGTMIIGGRWSVDDVAACFSGAVDPAAPGVWHIHDFGYLARVDAHTVLLTNRSELDMAALAALAARRGPAPSAVRAALDALPADRAIGVVVDRTSGDDFSATLDLPPGTGLVASMRVDKDGIVLDARADPHDAALATRLETKVKPQLAPLALFGDVQLTRTGSVLKLAGHLSDTFLSSVTSSALGK